MIIFGSSTKVASAAAGNFYCPNCKQATRYSRERVSRYFTLFFIPLFPFRQIGEYIRCRTCGSEFQTGVLRLTPEQIQQATAPWACPACGNRNAPTAGVCLSCGAAKNQAPPPLPGEPPPPPPPPDPLGIITTPPFSGERPARASSTAVKVLIVVAIIVALGVLGIVGLIFKAVRDVRAHPEQYAKKPGQLAFEDASKSIANDEAGATHGNTPEAESMARDLAALLDSTAGKEVPGIAKEDAMDHTGGKFLVYCRRNEDSCAFLVHVPNLRHLDSEAQELMAKLCYKGACVVIANQGAEHIQRLGVGIRGTMFYGAAVAGGYPLPKGAEALDNLEKLETEATDVKGLFPFFASTETSESARPAAPETTSPPPEPGTASSPPPPPAAPPSTPPAPAPAAPTAESSAPPVVAPHTTPAEEATPPAPNRRPPSEMGPPPAWVPIYAGAQKPARGLRREENGSVKGRANFDTSDPLEKVADFYQSKLREDGYEVSEEKPARSLFPKTTFVGKKSAGNVSIRAEIVQMKNKTMVNVAYEGPDGAGATPAK